MAKKNKQVDPKIQDLEDRKCPSVKTVYISGVPGWNEEVGASLYIDTDNNKLLILSGSDEAILPLDRIKSAVHFSEKEVKEKDKNRIGAGIAVAAINPLAGLIIGTSKKKKKKSKYNEFFKIVYRDKEGNTNTLLFRPLFASATLGYFNNFEKLLNACLPEEMESSTIEL